MGFNLKVNMSSIYSSFPYFDLGDIILREIDPIDDALCFYNYMNSPQVAPFLADSDRPKDLEGAISELNYWHSLFRYKRSIYWAIADSSNDNIIGTLGFNQYSEVHRKVEISYDLDYNYWSKGIMTRALAKILEFAFEKMGVIRAQATVACHNERSIKVLERLDFEHEGRMRNYCILEGRPVDYYMYARFKK
jgi:ribosomal-protein-alanine N-acetyltransferase